MLGSLSTACLAPASHHWLSCISLNLSCISLNLIHSNAHHASPASHAYVLSTVNTSQAYPILSPTISLAGLAMKQHHPHERPSLVRNRARAFSFGQTFATVTVHRRSMSSMAAMRAESASLPSALISGLAPSELTDDDAQAKLTPRAIVDLLNEHIIGQEEAKRAVAVAFRNRWRRHRVAEHLKDEISPKNILMIGPTGCGKTEIARRLAKLADSPFIKVEATKFTEVGYHGRDVDQIVRDLLESAIQLVRSKLKKKAAAEVQRAVEERLVKLLTADTRGALGVDVQAVLDALRAGELDSRIVEFEERAKMPDLSSLMQPGTGVMSINMKDLMPNRTQKRRLTVAEARPLLEDTEVERLFPQEVITKEAIRCAEQDGIVFIDEIDKIVVAGDYRHGSDPSSEGVQRDLLPILEGSVVPTKHGNVRTDHVLFVASGAFHSVKPSDMLAELQGRLPIRVELKGLTQHDFYRILTEPTYNMIRQQQMLLSAEGVELVFTDAAIHEVAALAEELNRTVENIGARRLHTVLERLLEEVSFSAPERSAAAAAEGLERATYVVDREEVSQKVRGLLAKQDLSKYIL